ncbi:helix-turn-helix domain-containing protein [Streptomyces sp. NPDC056728]|uniref:helix-turn-helix domain-containing protein n=1 Tax=Paenibacillus chitinolyticus TaxID=79263 RepID=UPI003670DC65
MHRESYADQLDYELDRLPGEVTTAITWFMKEHEIDRAELARLLDVTRGRVSQILSGDENLTLRTLAAVAAALDAHFEVRLVSNGQTVSPDGHQPLGGNPFEQSPPVDR